MTGPSIRYNEKADPMFSSGAGELLPAVMHVSGVARVGSSYEHFDPQLVGNERRVLVSELSGRSNIIATTSRHHVADDPELAEFVDTFIDQPEIFFSMSSTKRREIEHQMDAILSAFGQ